jgi:transcriptional regulator of NAD metabolism
MPFEDEKSVKKTFNITDLKRIYATKSADQFTVKLCYSKRDIFVKPLKVKDKKDVLKAIENKNETLINKTFDEIINKYVETADGSAIDTAKLTQQERQQILINIRVAAADKDRIVKIIHQCPQCENVVKDIPFSFDDINEKFYQATDEVVEIEGNGANIRIKVGPITREEEVEVEKFIKQEKKESNTEKQFVMISALIKAIDVIVGEDVQSIDLKSIKDKVDFIETLKSSDMDKIVNIAKSYEFGIKLPINFKCPKCNYEGVEEVNPTVFFML